MSAKVVPRPSSTEELRVALGELLKSEAKVLCPDRFALRVGARLFETISREEKLRPGSNTSEERRLRVLLDDDAASRSELCRLIACGDNGIGLEELLCHLWATTLENLAIDQPDYQWGA